MSTASAGTKRRGWFSSLLRTLGILCGLAAAAIGYQFLPHYDPVRLEAWNKVEPRINQTNEQTKTEAEKSSAKIKEFFAERKQHARAFATELLSFWGKWAFVKGYFSEGSHEQYIEECFERNVFSAEELKTLIESSVSGYVSEIQGRENQLLVAIRADLEGSELGAPQYLPALGGEDQFRREYEAMLERVLPSLNKDMGISVTREMVSFVGSEIAATLLMEVGASLATELGISGGILGAGAGAATFTFGVGLIAGILVDMALDWVIREAGYDPEGEVAAKVEESLDQLEHTILEGDKQTRERYDNASWNSTWSWSTSDRESASNEAKSIESSGGLGLKRQLHHINEMRSKLRQEALKSLILTGGAQ